MSEKTVNPCVTVFRIFLQDVTKISMYTVYTVFEGYESPFLLDEYLYERWYTAFGRQICKVLYRTASEGGSCEYP